ncbi:Protein CBG09929 [Caenorhabditis briggsae]|uniref:Protein CBG09929 n=1 Tax=Caenorhabditis briggsae TaxID=6238 RepID=A8X9Z4_CAEBR|nr:Protein CBG09929 [Caenorhabditis briggsae]CAP29459.2 Protein CBG09929 [Caenorhabditis briggsae]
MKIIQLFLLLTIFSGLVVSLTSNSNRNKNRFSGSPFFHGMYKKFMSIAPSFSMSTLPIYLLRAQHLMNLLTKDMENLKPESESMNDSFEVFKQGLAAVVSNIPAKVMRCIQPE